MSTITAAPPQQVRTSAGTHAAPPQQVRTSAGSEVSTITAAPPQQVRTSAGTHTSTAGTHLSRYARRYARSTSTAGTYVITKCGTIWEKGPPLVMNDVSL